MKMNKREKIISALMVFFILSPILWVATAKAEGTGGVSYVGMAKYYDNRKCAVVITNDDFTRNTTQFNAALGMLTAKQLYHTIGVQTNYSYGQVNWTYLQYWLDRGYTEAASHSRLHQPIPYTDYESEINGSKMDIITNVTMPAWYSNGEREYVYAWLEPGGQSDATARQWLGICGYLADRKVALNGMGMAPWDYLNSLYSRVGYTIEMGTPPWMGASSNVTYLNGLFDAAYSAGGIYSLMTHPAWVNWSSGSYADQHLSYIANRSDVWYVPFGLSYVYELAKARVSVTQNAGSEYFTMSISAQDHADYGFAYPATYIFTVPSNWTSAAVQYRHTSSEAWADLPMKTWGDHCNGINAARFDVDHGRVYVSVGFSSVSNEIQVRISGPAPQPAPVPAPMPDPQPTPLPEADGDTCPRCSHTQFAVDFLSTSAVSLTCLHCGSEYLVTWHKGSGWSWKEVM